MRNRLWDNLQNAKFKSDYLNKVSKRAYGWGNGYSFFLAFASASSVTAWTVWNDIPKVWGAIVAISQLLHIAKPYFPFLKNDRDLFEMGHQYEVLYLSYEKLWFKYEKGKITEDNTENEFYKLRDSEMDITNKFKHIHCPNFKKLAKEVSDEVATELARTFNRG